MVRSKINKIKNIALIMSAVLALVVSFTPPAYAYQCGGGKAAVSTSIDFGCSQKGNPVFDLTFAIIRLLSDGVGIVIVLSVVIAGIQYTTSADNPRSVEAAKARLRSAVLALAVFIFAYALLNYLVPGGFLN